MNRRFTSYAAPLLLMAAAAQVLGEEVRIGPPDPFAGKPLPRPLDVDSRTRAELDLLHAEAQLAAAGTPGAKRKAARKVDAIRRRLGVQA